MLSTLSTVVINQNDILMIGKLSTDIYCIIANTVSFSWQGPSLLFQVDNLFFSWNFTNQETRLTNVMILYISIYLCFDILFTILYKIHYKRGIKFRANLNVCNVLMYNSMILIAAKSKTLCKH